MIYLNNVGKTFGSPPKQVEALKNIDLRINKGEFIVIRGPSGSGKTTLLLSIGGMLRPSSGIVRIEEKDIYTMNESERTKFRASNIGFVFQMFYLVPYLNVLENIKLSAGRIKNGTKQEKAMELVNHLGLNERIVHKPGELSAGERQRVALARALVHQPKIILADEPTGNLDPENSSEVVKILEEYHKTGGTVFIVTHSKDADKFADRIFYLNKGEIIS
jgi:ABC-type lipoprotein export system ATPase subunit